MKKKELDILGVLLGIIIGAFLGFFVSTRFVREDVPVMGGEKEVGFIYLVEVSQYDNPTGANNMIKELSLKDIYAITIEKDNYYYVYAGVYGTSEEATALKDTLINYGFNSKVSKEYILDYTNTIIDEKEKEFYDYCISCYLLNLNGETYDISYDSVDFETNIELFQDISMLGNLKKETLINKTRLQIYSLLRKIK